MTQYFDPFWQAEDSSGAPIAEAQLQFYETGTTTPKDTYTDSGFGTPNSNPVEADGFGRFPPIFLDISGGLYTVLLLESDGATVIDTQDEVGGALSSFTETFTSLVQDTSPQLGGALDTNSFSINESEGATIADSATPDIFNNTDGNTVHLAGTTTITDFPDAPSIGIWRKVIFDGIRTLTHGSGITLPGSANITTAAGDYAFVYADAVDAFTVLYFKADGTAVVAVGEVIQTVSVTDGAVATGTTIMPNDDTIPQNDEGNEFMTLAITPTDASNILLIFAVLFVGHSITNNVAGIALFQDSTADSIAAGQTLSNNAATAYVHSLNHRMVAGTTSATTFKVHVGNAGAATLTFNGAASARKLGGVASSTLIIMEVKP